MRKKSKWLRRIFRVFAWCAGISVVGFAGTLVALNSAAVQRFWVTRILEKQGIEAHFESLHFDFLISDRISLSGASVTLPDGTCLRVEKFSARHNGTRGLFTGTPSFRDFSCEGFAVDDARGRRQLAFSARAKQIGADFLPWAPLEKFTLGSPLAWSFFAEDLYISRAGTRIAEGNVRGDFVGAEPLNLSGTVCGDLAALLAQPVFSKINNVSSGTFELSGQGKSARLSLKNLRSRYGEIEIPALNFSAKRGGGTTGTLSAEIFGKQKSCAEVNFSHLAFGEGQLIFSGEMRAETLVVADILHTGLLFRGWNNLSRAEKSSSRTSVCPPAPARVPATKFPAGASPVSVTEKPDSVPAPAVPDEAPSAEKIVFSPAEVEIPSEALWHGVSGSMDFCVERVVFPENEFGEHRGSFSVNEKRIGFQYTLPDLYRGNAVGAFTLDFSEEAPHYRFGGTLVGRGIEIHQVIPALRSRNPAPIEGRFDLDFRLSADADLPEHLEKSFAVDFGVKNVGSGRIRIFNADSKKIRLAGDVLKIGGSLASMFGGLTRNLEPRAASLADAAGFVKDLLTDFSYSELSARGRYRAGGDLVCEDFGLVGKDLRIRGNATARPLAGEAPELWPLKFLAQPEVCGELAEALRVIGVLRGAGTPDGGGFVAVRPVEFSGTAASGSERFFEDLMNAASGRKIRHSSEEGVPAENLLDIFAP
ncbi:MAG: hypothetical protein J6L64_00295 [Opitutales bacterium]|nr:hypothetical protein [Opitutales bacterium]